MHQNYVLKTTKSS